MSRATISGNDIYYESYGAGEPIVFVGGLGSFCDSWRYQLEYFGKDNLKGRHRNMCGYHFRQLSFMPPTKGPSFELFSSTDSVKFFKHSFYINISCGLRRPIYRSIYSFCCSAIGH